MSLGDQAVSAEADGADEAEQSPEMVDGALDEAEAAVEGERLSARSLLAAVRRARQSGGDAQVLNVLVDAHRRLRGAF